MARRDMPPRQGTGRKAGVVRFGKEAERLRQHPGEFMRVTTYPWEQEATARTIGNHIRTGRYPAFRPAGAWECETHTIMSEKKQVVGIWVRYIGENGEWR